MKTRIPWNELMTWWGVRRESNNASWTINNC